jgi:hypothetical protein
MTPEQLLANMLDVYSLATTYRDSGQVLRYYSPVGYDVERLPGVMEFRTAYSRPSRLRFEDRHLHADGRCFAHKISWADGAEVRRWTHPDHTRTHPTSLHGTFTMAVLTVHPVLALLTEGQAEGWLTNLTQPALLADENLDGAACHRVRCRCSWWNQKPTPEEQRALDEGTMFLERVTGMRVPPGRTVHLPLTVWIDRRTLLVRRIESATITDLATEEAVLTCRPEVGVALDAAELLFDPPDPADAPGTRG